MGLPHAMKLSFRHDTVKLETEDIDLHNNARAILLVISNE